MCLDAAWSDAYYPRGYEVTRATQGGARLARIKIGELEIVSILDLESPFAMNGVLPDVAESAFEPYRPVYPEAFAESELKLSISSYVIAGGGEAILVDTGLGRDVIPGTPGRLVDSLRAEGFAPEDIGTVVFTHLHPDHVGWNFEDGKATFGKARYVVQEVDWRFFSARKDEAVVQAQVLPLEATGALELVSGETQLRPQITLVPTPGHTPGHQSVIVTGGSDRAFIAGDVGHHPAQAQETAWRVGFDNDAAKASETRERVMAQLEQDGSRACFGHFPTPGMGLIVRRDGRRVFQAL
jgi:glyoxylase-like metal-dependent hydrolase (beta-lactamase superfamily II)